jgi:D-tagatose-1,6-bisphosphate aldolase subunit GatZ/KbaZ
MNYLHTLLKNRQQGICCGVASFCTANEFVIGSIFEQAKSHNEKVLIESTANQVNQEGGYTGMQPEDFSKFIYGIAKACNFPVDRIMLGGDHLGPLPWFTESEDVAMSKAIELVSLYIRAGFTKIHLDTSMKLANDQINKQLDYTIIANRCALLYKACESAFKERLHKNPSAIHPVFVIGSEVPAPGGFTHKKKSLTLTRSVDFEKTIRTYKNVFTKHGLDHAWPHIIGIVVGLGVEFGNNQIYRYDRMKARTLCHALKKYPALVFEGHSTDYQTFTSLKEMVEDGVMILKVGPALTSALREALFSLSLIERELISDHCADFPGQLERAMIAKPDYWNMYYDTTSLQASLDRKYSLLDRSRYYLSIPDVLKAIYQLFNNLHGKIIPLGMLRQYFPLQYINIQDGNINLDARAIVQDYIGTIIKRYNFSTIPYLNTKVKLYPMIYQDVLC